MRKFYVGNRETARGDNTHAKETLAEAIEQAKRYVEKTGQEQYIVKVIRVVRQRPQPIVVETIR